MCQTRRALSPFSLLSHLFLSPDSIDDGREKIVEASSLCSHSLIVFFLVVHGGNRSLMVEVSPSLDRLPTMLSNVPCMNYVFTEGRILKREIGGIGNDSQNEGDTLSEIIMIVMGWLRSTA